MNSISSWFCKRNHCELISLDSNLRMYLVLCIWHKRNYPCRWYSHSHFKQYRALLRFQPAFDTYAINFIGTTTTFKHPISSNFCRFVAFHQRYLLLAKCNGNVFRFRGFRILFSQTWCGNQQKKRKLTALQCKKNKINELHKIEKPQWIQLFGCLCILSSVTQTTKIDILLLFIVPTTLWVLNIVWSSLLVWCTTFSVVVAGSSQSDVVWADFFMLVCHWFHLFLCRNIAWISGMRNGKATTLKTSKNLCRVLKASATKKLQSG